MTHPCADCLRVAPFYDAHRSLLIFDELAQKLVHALKYAAEFWVGRFYRERLPGLTGEFKAIDVIVPVPLHADRLRERGYNQSLVLARSWRVILNRPVAHDALVRVKNTASQTGLSRAERRRNLQDAFAARVPANVRGRNVLLVDDVHTTGATLSAAAKALKTAGAVGVTAATLAVVPLDNGAART
jgi:ComF family protein